MRKVSVIIPFYQHVDWLTEAVESVLQQNYDNIETIVINDGSSEDISDFLERFKGKIIYEMKANGGPATARNRGIEIATGDFIAFLDSDDIWLPQKLFVQVKAMEMSNAIWSYCGYSTFGMGKSKIYNMTGEKCANIQRYYIPYIGTPCVMIRREYLVKHPECRFKPELRYGEDVYMWLMINAELPILAIPENLVKVRMRGTNAGKRARVQLQARGNIWKYRKTCREKLIDPFNIDFLFTLASELCVMENAIVINISHIIRSEKLLEFISKILFIVPWFMFKLDRVINRGNIILK